MKGGFVILTNKPELVKKGVSFLLSLLFHALIILSILHLKYTYKIYPDEVEIREVIIVPPEKLYIPNYIETFPKISNEENYEFLGEEKKISNKFETEAHNIPRPIPEKNLSPHQIIHKSLEGRTDGITLPSALTSKFKLKLPSASETDSSTNYKLDLSLDYGKPQQMLSTKNNSTKKEINLWKHIYPDYSRMHSKISPAFSGRYRTGTAHLQGKASTQTKDYDLTPWAEEVVERIQKNWLISPALKINGKGLVIILAIVERNGELQSAEIVNSSAVPLFDRAALKAIDTSSPFPELPDDYPDDNLEVYFVFEYND